MVTAMLYAIKRAMLVTTSMRYKGCYRDATTIYYGAY